VLLLVTDSLVVRSTRHKLILAKGSFTVHLIIAVVVVDSTTTGVPCLLSFSVVFFSLHIFY
jgi:hypothetical protein